MNELTNAQRVLAVKTKYGLSWDGLGAALGRSGRMMRKIARGETSGDSYMAAIEELDTTGKVSRQPPRRRNKKGDVVPVRAKHGVTIPSDTKAKVIGDAKGRKGRLKIHPTQHLSGGGKIDRIEMPAGKQAKGRSQAFEAATENLRRTTRAQSREDKRVMIRLVGKSPDGKVREYSVGSKGGYHASDVLSDIRKVHGGSYENWAMSQIQSVYPDSELTIVEVTQTEFSAIRSKEIRKQQDAMHTRRRRYKAR